MSLTKQAGLLAGAVALTLTGGSFADTPSQATNKELKARVAELESRLSAVEAGKSNHWLTERRADEIRGLIGDVLADADTRASLLAQGMTAGYQDGALIQSADGNWSLKTNIHMQQRFVYNTMDTGAGAPVDDDRVGFENTRTKFILTGNIVSPDWFYKIEENIGSNGGTSNGGADRVATGDAYLGYDYGNGWSIKAGTYKAPVLREELVDSRYQLAVERSVVNYIFTGGRTDGVSLTWESDQFRVDAGINDGINNGQTAYGIADVDFALTVRGEWLAMGNWDQFMDFTSPNGSETGLLVGAAFHYETNEDDGLGLLDSDTLIFTLDGSYEAGGWNVYGAFLYKSVEATAVVGADVDQTGIIFQGGYYFTDDWEGFARYEWADLDIATADDVSIITFGATRYFDGHNAKWTTDLGYALDGIDVTAVGATFDGDITGFRPDSVAGDDGQVVIRSQVQIVF